MRRTITLDSIYLSDDDAHSVVVQVFRDGTIAIGPKNGSPQMKGGSYSRDQAVALANAILEAAGEQPGVQPAAPSEGFNFYSQPPGTYHASHLGREYIAKVSGIRRVDANRVAADGDDLAFVKGPILMGSYVNAVEGAKAPSVAFGDFEKAIKEAVRLATKAPGTRVLTLKIVDTTKAEVKTTVERGV